MPDSVSEAIGDKARTAILALGITDGTPASVVAVVKRKNPGQPESNSPARTEIVVSVLEDRAEPLDGRRRLQTYSLAAVIIRPGTGAKAAPDGDVEKWREWIIKALDDKAKAAFAGLPAGSKINKVDYVGGKLPFDPNAAPKGFDYSALNFSAEVIETRAVIT